MKSPSNHSEKNPQPKISAEQFNALVEAIRGDLTSKSTQAARAVLVDGLTQPEAVKLTGASRSNVFNTVKKYASLYQKFSKLFNQQ